MGEKFLFFISFFISEIVFNNLKFMLKLSFPNYEFRLKKINQKRFIFDVENYSQIHKLKIFYHLQTKIK